MVPAPRLLLLAAALAAAGAGVAATRRAPAAPAREEADEVAEVVVPPFALVDASGARLTDADLRGRVWLATFVFTRCPTVCPRSVRALAALEAPLAALPGGGDARLVAITVDPEHDAPAVLAAWARRHELDPGRWLLLGGDRVAIWTLAGRGFKLPVAREPGPPGHPILHAQKVVVVDRAGRIRGWFDPPHGATERRALLDAVARALAGPRPGSASRPGETYPAPWR